ncbi:MAG: alpha/beta hydrolase [Ignavibacteria bacterium]
MNELKVKLKSGIEISYFDKGISDKTIICIHGLGSNKKAFLRNIDELSQHARIIAIDLPNYGNSSKGDYPSTLRFFSDIVIEFVQTLNLNDVILCGHSMGGQIAILTALNYPKLIAALILAAPAGLEKFTSDEIKRLEKIFTFDSIKNMSDEQIKFNVKLNFYNFPPEAEFMITDRIELRNDPSFDFYCLTVERAFQDILRNSLPDSLQYINQPTLLFFGKQDALIPNKALHPILVEKLANEACNRLKKCKLVLVENCGHFIQFEKPDIFNKEVLDFIKVI